MSTQTGACAGTKLDGSVTRSRGALCKQPKAPNIVPKTERGNRFEESKYPSSVRPPVAIPRGSGGNTKHTTYWKLFSPHHLMPILLADRGPSLLACTARGFFFQDGDGAAWGSPQHRPRGSSPQTLETAVAQRGARQRAVNEDNPGVFHGKVCQQTLAVTPRPLPGSARGVRQLSPAHRGSGACGVGKGGLQPPAPRIRHSPAGSCCFPP